MCPCDTNKNIILPSAVTKRAGDDNCTHAMMDLLAALKCTQSPPNVLLHAGLENRPASTSLRCARVRRGQRQINK